MFLLDFFLKLKFKYVISFICVITFYIFAFEKRYFQINSDWKVACHDDSISLCEFELKVTDINFYRTKNVAIFSKSKQELLIVDIFNSSMTNADILSTPKVNLFQENLDNFVLFDIKQKSDGSLIFLGIRNSGKLFYYSDWNLIFQSSVFNEEIANKQIRFTFHSLDLLVKENIILLSGEMALKSDIEKGSSMIFCLNATDGSLQWKVQLSDSQRLLEENRNHSGSSSNSEVFTHWKLHLMRHHRELNHLKQKARHINLDSNYPIYFTGKNQIRLSKSEKTLEGFDRRRSEKNERNGDENYNSISVLHRHGISLLDIHSGLLLASDNIELDSHSTYTLWPSIDHQQRESLVQIKFISKLDHYSNDHMDITHNQDQLTTDTETHHHKIHCNLLFHRLNPSASLTHETSSWFVSHLCDPISYMDYPRFSEKSWLEDPMKAVAPLITNDYATPYSLWGRLYHLIGRKLLDSNSKNTICMSSDGLITSLSSHGHQNWRSNAQVGWLHISRMVRMFGSSFVDSATKQVYENHFFPSLTEMTLSYLNQTIRAVLSLGFDSISLVDLSDGYLLASHSLPCTPVDNPVLIAVPYQGMFAISGHQVIVVKCENMVIGFSVTHYVPWVYFITLCILMLVAVLFLMWSLDPRNKYFGELWV